MATADERIGGNLRRFRERDSQSQAELARRMAAAGHPWQQSTVARTEGGQQPLRAAELETLAKMFRVALDAFFRHVGEAAEQELVQGAHDRLRDSTVDAVEAVTQFHAARSGARRAARDGVSSEYAHVREAAGSLDEELLHATLGNVLVAAEVRWEELRGDLDPADAAPPRAAGSGAFPAEALQAAAALYGQAAVTAVTPKFLAYIIEEMGPEVVDEVIAAVAEVARQEKNGTVLRHIRQAGLERLAAQGVAAELTRRTAIQVRPEYLHQFLTTVFSDFQDQPGFESAAKAAVDYADSGGTSMLAMAGLFVEKMPADTLPEFVPLRERSVEALPKKSRVIATRAAVRETRPQPVIPVANDEGRS
jgi:transcriptional regulator with XRE-family HTH domain